MIFNLEELVSTQKDRVGQFGGITLVDGSFDPLHHGHIEYFKEALTLGNKLGCLIAPDSYTKRKHKVLIPQSSRASIIDWLSGIDYVFYGEIETQIALEFIRPKIFFKGPDWRERIPKEIIKTCYELDCEIRFGQTKLASSNEILRNLNSSE